MILYIELYTLISSTNRKGVQFFFLRHGESLWNLKKLCQGKIDIELSDKGIKEAENFGKKSSHLPISHIFTSPLKRAQTTAQILQKNHPNAGITVLKEFEERGYGYLEGGSSEAMYIFEEQEKRNPDVPIHPSVESLEAIKLRLEKGLKTAFAKDASPFIVSHGRLFVSLCQYLGVPHESQIKNLSLYQFIQTLEKWEIREILF